MDAFACEPLPNPVDTTGAGDLLTAPTSGRPARRRAGRQAPLGGAVRDPRRSAATGIGGAVTEAELMRAGNELDLVPPPLAGIYSG
jgi:hypothetical protein